jgi:hypothetical protein
MMTIISFLMLFVPGLIALRLHGIAKVTKENWQSALLAYLVYSLLIIFIDYTVMFISYPIRTVSFSPWVMQFHSNIYGASFVVKYTLVALVSSVGLPLFPLGLKLLNTTNWQAQTKELLLKALLETKKSRRNVKQRPLR